MSLKIDEIIVPDEATLLRRIHPSQVVEDKNLGGFRFSSAAFKDPNMSVDIEPLLTAAGLDWNSSLRDYPGYSLARLGAGEARALNQTVVHVPLPDNPAHGEVRGKKSPGVANRLLQASSPVLIKPPG